MHSFEQWAGKNLAKYHNKALLLWLESLLLAVISKKGFDQTLEQILFSTLLVTVYWLCSHAYWSWIWQEKLHSLTVQNKHNSISSAIKFHTNMLDKSFCQTVVKGSSDDCRFLLPCVTSGISWIWLEELVQYSLFSGSVIPSVRLMSGRAKTYV